MSPHYVKQQRPITDALRRSVAEDLPELAEIKRRFALKAVEAGGAGAVITAELVELAGGSLMARG